MFSCERDWIGFILDLRKGNQTRDPPITIEFWDEGIARLWRVSSHLAMEAKKGSFSYFLVFYSKRDCTGFTVNFKLGNRTCNAPITTSFSDERNTHGNRVLSHLAIEEKETNSLCFVWLSAETNCSSFHINLTRWKWSRNTPITTSFWDERIACMWRAVSHLAMEPEEMELSPIFLSFILREIAPDFVLI